MLPSDANARLSKRGQVTQAQTRLTIITIVVVTPSQQGWMRTISAPGSSLSSFKFRFENQKWGTNGSHLLPDCQSVGHLTVQLCSSRRLLTVAVVRWVFSDLNAPLNHPVPDGPPPVLLFAISRVVISTLDQASTGNLTVERSRPAN